MPEETKDVKTDKKGDKSGKKPKKRRLWLWILLGFLFTFLVGGYTFYEYSNTPGFCNNCHIMKPYYDAWASSKHSEFGCVTCHISPEEGAKWQAKIQGMMQALKYLTRTYASKPYAEIEDSSCLRSGCHDQRFVENHSTATFKNNVVFDHKPHLTEVRRGKRLRCTSCHAQIVVGNHMEVTTTTCYLCHFRPSDDPGVVALGECRLCHKALPDHDIEHNILNPQNPDQILETVSFNHMNLEGADTVDCRSCHSHSIEGIGTARTDRCFVCHNDPKQIDRIGELDFIHDNHITEHNVTCERCHDTILHQSTSNVKLAGKTCTQCHTSLHNGQQQMYLGIGGKGVDEPMPSVKYSALVNCSGCHRSTDVKGQFIGSTNKAQLSVCEECHGELAEDYVMMFEDTAADIKDRLATMKTLRSRLQIQQMTDEQKAIVEGIDYDLAFIEQAKGWAHNWDYSSALLDYVEEKLEELR